MPAERRAILVHQGKGKEGREVSEGCGRGWQGQQCVPGRGHNLEKSRGKKELSSLKNIAFVSASRLPHERKNGQKGRDWRRDGPSHPEYFECHPEGSWGTCVPGVALKPAAKPEFASGCLICMLAEAEGKFKRSPLVDASGLRGFCSRRPGQIGPMSTTEENSYLLWVPWDHFDVTGHFSGKIYA